MKTIQEIMGLVETYGEVRENYGEHRKFDAYQASASYRDLIESALRELVERKPLDQKVALKMWAETGYIDHESGGIELIRKVERAHGIGA